ncbi:MAG: hypothetical protein A3H01_02400 [Candidatus Wildermuthbacteria bacterium RIFCSPLOWO2_12_FULL_40_9]|uniref:Uncharacterized protein n=2 Tax=Candidatus Wildermuthiibacteriota TaxID=1817923 RepID=A0A1G2RC02_9BACT|nr:MAG: hypothetical protein A3F15_00810 [Candidatus Wildermuthbacteria bacterium RIFCSPHIGHO2_12_FULL_40_12]OHA76944.1 MAG: hypothetical protein A3H01_02400 [Candidatus Wildermuthbacteria bacterium RIFCSPLOWO2_12_FULL_40_9]
MSYQKILGSVIIILGLAVIFYTLFLSYNIFTAKAAAPEVFKISGQSNDITTANTQKQGLPSDIQKLIEEQLQGQLASFMPANAMPRLLNLISWSVLAGIFIFGGSQIAGIGVNLIRK